MSKDVTNRVSILGRVFDLLWSDDEFYRDVSSHKKISSSGRFPKCDQWCDEEGFHMAFALAGYSPKDVKVDVRERELFVEGFGRKLVAENAHEKTNSLTVTGCELSSSEMDEEYPATPPRLAVQTGMIVRGIARRNFKTKYYINPLFDMTHVSAVMNNGLLEIIIPRKEISKKTNIDVREI